MLDIWFMVADIILFSLLPFSVCYALSSWVILLGIHPATTYALWTEPLCWDLDAIYPC